MKMFHASTTGSKKVAALSLALALILASISVINAVAAPPADPDPSVQVFDHQVRELNADKVWLSNFKSHPEDMTAINSAKEQQWLSRYAFALTQADAIVAGQGVTVTTNPSMEEQEVTRLNRVDQSAEQNLATWLHEIHGLQQKLTGETPETDNS